MPATITPVLLSGSTNGRGIKVAATSTPGTTIHATGISATIFDKVELWAHNTSTSPVKLTVEWGGTTSPDDTIIITLAAQSGLVPIDLGLRLNGTGAAATTIKAFAASANVVCLVGNVDRYTP